jgi:NAD-dependent dihydropyrimidine dehydrogenase PreA subunit
MDGTRVAVAADAPSVEAGRAGAGAFADADALLGVVEEALGRLRALPLDAGVSDLRLAGSVERLARIERMVAAEQLRRIAVVDSRGAHEAVGAGSVSTMLTSRLGLSGREARVRAETASALSVLPLTAARLAAGEIGVGQAETAARALRDVTTAGDAGEKHEQAAAALDRVVAVEGVRCDRQRLRQRLDTWAETRGHRTLADAEQRAWRRRRAWLAAPAGPDRMARLTAELPAVQATKLRAALDPLLRKTSVDDQRSPEQRCADALTTLAEHALDRGGLPRTALGRPHVLLVTTVDSLDGTPGAAPATLDGHGPVSTQTARQLVCDADVTPVTITNGRVVLDVGRTRRTPTRAQRAAVIARDQSCVGCGAPASRCEIHHIRWWSRGGPTDLDNLTLLCWNCHTHVHHHHWQIHEDPDGRYTARPSDRQPPGRRPPERPPPERPLHEGWRPPGDGASGGASRDGPSPDDQQPDKPGRQHHRRRLLHPT